MPSMIEDRSILVCFESKLFAIGGGGAALESNSEVFDKTSNMFVTLETPNFLSLGAVRVGSNIFAFQNYT